MSIVLRLAVPILLSCLVLAEPAAAKTDPVYAKDVQFALKEMKKGAGKFFKLKGIDWKAVSRDFTKEAREVESVEEHYVLLVRLIARLKDGHASIRPLEKAKDVKWPLTPEKPQSGPGMFWCRSGGKIYVKSAWSAAGDAGVKAGMQVVKVDKLPAEEWLARKIAERGDLQGFSTDAQAFFAACHWGLSGDQGSPMSVECRTIDGKRKKATIHRRRASTVPSGPAFRPEGLERLGRQSYGKTASGFGYIHLRDSKGSLPEQTDKMLAAIGDVPGLILDCRANGGGAFDHGGFFGRFVPKGQTFKAKSAGPNPYPGPMVVIVDPGTRSAGETLSGMFKEYGRGYMIGEDHTAGMSSSKTTVELPSGLFALYFSVDSNMNSFNKGRGIEGIGVIPHEIVEYDPKDLSERIDTLIRRAEELLRAFPQKQVRYRPPR